MAIYGPTVVVGAAGKKSFSGAAYVFAPSGTTWTQQAEVTDPGGAKNYDFGLRVAISGSTAVVGASGEDSSKGAAYVFAGL